MLKDYFLIKIVQQIFFINKRRLNAFHPLINPNFPQVWDFFSSIFKGFLTLI